MNGHVSEPARLLFAGDLHGDVAFVEIVFAAAIEENVDAIVQCGDFGYWEHFEGGAEYLDMCSTLATESGIPLYWIDGNHENHSLLRARYGPGGPLHDPTPEGFWLIREGLYYIPRGTRWVWSGKHLMGLGGAYSVDKAWRVEKERKAYYDHITKNSYREKAGAAPRPYDPESHKLWWPEEQLSVQEVEAALADLTPLDILITHDKPRNSNPSWNRKNIPDCYPSQDKISTVVRMLRPKLLVHGHLHFRYRDTVRCGDDGQYCRVEGLNCNVMSREGADYGSSSAWHIVDLDDIVPELS